jgi:hypothetical protein
MKRTIILTIALLAAAAALTFGQALTVDYLDGNVELKTTKGWKSLSIGDQVPADASVRISQGGSLELSRGQQHITLVKDGVYALTDLSRTAMKAGSAGLGATFGQKLKSLTTEKGSGGTTVGGVRGAQQGEAEGLLWVDESDDVKRKVADLLEKGQYTEAAPIASSALSDATGDSDRRELSFMLATAYFGSGDTVKAYRTVARVAPDASDPYYADFVILKAQILLSTGYYADGITLLKPLIASQPKVPYAQAAYLLSALCSRGLGDESSASAALKTGYDLDQNSDTGKMIAQQMK